MAELQFDAKRHLLENLPYVFDRFSYKRRLTREVKVGDLGIGGTNPIRVQSMTISDTQNIKATVDEAEILYRAGCELVRITAPSQKDAECLKEIRAELNRRGCRVPLCADIHFTPNAAMLACEYVEKVRVNPGNFADKKVFAQRDYTADEYNSELQRIYEKFSPLVKRAKELGRVLRIGTNHGSLSDRITNRYGDTPQGMVASAMEFIDICRDHNFHDVVISMKSSNPRAMIQAYRLLVARMNELSYDYPLHLGVTEAGAGEDGRIKSAVGIGSLLEDGIGDTVRVSLTEDSIHEIPVCYELVRRFTPPGDSKLSSVAGPAYATRTDQSTKVDREIHPFAYVRNPVSEEKFAGNVNFGGEQVSRVQIAVGQVQENGNLDEVAQLIGFRSATDMQRLSDQDVEEYRRKERAEILEIDVASAHPAGLKALRTALKPLLDRKIGLALALRFPQAEEKYFEMVESGDWALIPLTPAGLSTEKLKSLVAQAEKKEAGIHWQVSEGETEPLKESAPEAFAQAALTAVKSGGPLKPQTVSFKVFHPVACYRYFVQACRRENLKIPITLCEPKPCPMTNPEIRSASVMGSLLCDGIGDAIAVASHNRNAFGRLQFAYNFLQATGNRISKTEFISCPSCGRTLFNLQETTERIRGKLGHLKGMKLAIMGCIVNGPGEMADAHFGYVGAGPGRINLYVGKECVQKNIPQEIADQRLIDLIKEQGMWVDP